MTPELSSADLRRIMRSTEVGYPLPDGSLAPVEKCGLLRGLGGRVTSVKETRNVSSAPLDSFEIDPAALLRAYRLQRAPGGLEVIGFYHTHPGGEAFPSVRDAACAAADGRLWLIATSGEATLWRAVPDGRVHGRFDPVRFDLRVGKRVDKDVAAVQMRGVGENYIASLRESSL